MALEHSSDALKADRDMVLAAALRSPDALRFATPEVKERGETAGHLVDSSGAMAASELLEEARQGLDEGRPEVFQKASEAFELFQRGQDDARANDALRVMISFQHHQAAVKERRKPVEALQLVEEHLASARASGNRAREACVLLSLADALA
eukprot:g10834.t1